MYVYTYIFYLLIGLKKIVFYKCFMIFLILIPTYYGYINIKVKIIYRHEYHIYISNNNEYDDDVHFIVRAHPL